MRKEIKEYCKACKECNENSKCTLKAYLHPHELAQAPFQVIGIDFLGPIKPASTNGNKHILVVTDFFFFSLARSHCLKRSKSANNSKMFIR